MLGELLLEEKVVKLKLDLTALKVYIGLYTPEKAMEYINSDEFKHCKFSVSKEEINNLFIVMDREGKERIKKIVKEALDESK